MNLTINQKNNGNRFYSRQNQEIQFGAANLDRGAIALLRENVDIFRRECALVGDHALTDITGMSQNQVKSLQNNFPNTAFSHENLTEVLKIDDGFDKFLRAENICRKAPEVSEKEVKKVLAKHLKSLVEKRKALRDEEMSILSELGIIPNRN